MNGHRDAVAGEGRALRRDGVDKGTVVVVQTAAVASLREEGVNRGGVEERRAEAHANEVHAVVDGVVLGHRSADRVGRSKDGLVGEHALGAARPDKLVAVDAAALEGKAGDRHLGLVAHVAALGGDGADLGAVVEAACRHGGLASAAGRRVAESRPLNGHGGPSVPVTDRCGADDGVVVEGVRQPSAELAENAHGVAEGRVVEVDARDRDLVRCPAEAVVTNSKLRALRGEDGAIVEVLVEGVHSAVNSELRERFGDEATLEHQVDVRVLVTDAARDCHLERRVGDREDVNDGASELGGAVEVLEEYLNEVRVEGAVPEGRGVAVDAVNEAVAVDGDRVATVEVASGRRNRVAHRSVVVGLRGDHLHVEDIGLVGVVQLDVHCHIGAELTPVVGGGADHLRVGHSARDVDVVGVVAEEALVRAPALEALAGDSDLLAARGQAVVGGNTVDARGIVNQVAGGDPVAEVGPVLVTASAAKVNRHVGSAAKGNGRRDAAEVRHGVALVQVRHKRGLEAVDEAAGIHVRADKVLVEALAEHAQLLATAREQAPNVADVVTERTLEGSDRRSPGDVEVRAGGVARAEDDVDGLVHARLVGVGGKGVKVRVRLAARADGCVLVGDLSHGGDEVKVVGRVVERRALDVNSRVGAREGSTGALVGSYGGHVGAEAVVSAVDQWLHRVDAGVVQVHVSDVAEEAVAADVSGHALAVRRSREGDRALRHGDGGEVHRLEDVAESHKRVQALEAY
mmetsp:Transcript_3150/g.11009  ORF Transcript_3150/g.11009 Transcript_3150/m.11009 type:complete len:744 (-) Transcript_3150:2026-4257(-)